MLEQIGNITKQFGPFIAFLATILAGVLVYWIELKGRRRTLRMSFLKELKSNEGLDTYVAQRDKEDLERGESILDEVRPLGCPYTTSVYENSVGKIGILTEKEVEALVDFYSLVIITRNQLDVVLDLENSWRGVKGEIDTGLLFSEKELKTITDPILETSLLEGGFCTGNINMKIRELNKNMTKLVKRKKKAIQEIQKYQ